MKLKTNLFECITQHYVEDGYDMHWWIDDEDLEDFKETWSDAFEEENEEYKAKITDTRELSGKEWNEWWIGGTYGDCEGIITNEPCPKCEHILVDPEELEEPTARFCSNHECDYINEAYEAYSKKLKKTFSRDSNEPPEIKIRLEGEDVFQFCKRVGLQMDARNDKFYIKDNTYWSPCIVCKKDIPVSDFYIGQRSGFAVVHFSHEDCSNGGPSVGVPFKQKTKDEWDNLLFGGKK